MLKKMGSNRGLDVVIALLTVAVLAAAYFEFRGQLAPGSSDTTAVRPVAGPA